MKNLFLLLIGIVILSQSAKTVNTADIAWIIDRLSVTLSNSDTLSIHITVIEDHHYKELDYKLEVTNLTDIRITEYPIIKKEKSISEDGKFSQENVKKYTIKIPEDLPPGEYKISFQISGKVKTKEGIVMDIQKQIKTLKIIVD